MRAWQIILTIGLLTAGFVAAAESPPSAPPALERFTLDNGLRVWHLQRVESDSVVVAVSVHAGSRNETPEDNGISHFLEHMVFAETEQYPKGDVTDVITKRGGIFNATTLYEKTIYYTMLASKEFSTAAEWVAEVVFHPTLPEDRIERERNVIFQEKGGKSPWYVRKLAKHGFGYDVEKKLREILFPRSSLALPTIGEDKPLVRIDSNALESYYRAHYAPNNAVLVVVGNVSPAQVRKACDEYFAGLQPGNVSPPDPAPDPPEHLPKKPIKVRAPTARSQCTFITGARTVNPRHEDWWPLEMLGAYVRLAVQKEARLQKGLAYDIQVTNDGYSDTGLFYLRTSCERKNRHELRTIVDGQLDALRRGEIDADRFAEAKTLLIGRRALAMETNMSHAVWLETLSCFYNDDEALPDYETCVEEVSANDIVRAAQTYLTPERMAAVMHVPLF